jgi:hypothetical protein
MAREVSLPSGRYDCHDANAEQTFRHLPDVNDVHLDFNSPLISTIDSVKRKINSHREKSIQHIKISSLAYKTYVIAYQLPSTFRLDTKRSNEL